MLSDQTHVCSKENRHRQIRANIINHKDHRGQQNKGQHHQAEALRVNVRCVIATFRGYPLNQRMSVQTEHNAIPRLNQNGHTPEPGPRSGTQPITSPSLCIFHIIPSEKTNIPMAINSSAFRVDIAFSINQFHKAITSSTRATVGVTKAEKFRR